MQTQHMAQSLMVYARLLLVCGVLLLFLNMIPASDRAPFVSSELRFTDRSSGAMHIVPASCASSPSSYHGSLATSGDGLGFISATGQSEYGAFKNSVYLCVTNNTGTSYFIPANTAAEMNAVKAVGSSIPNLQVW